MEQNREQQWRTLLGIVLQGANLPKSWDNSYYGSIKKHFLLNQAIRNDSDFLDVEVIG